MKSVFLFFTAIVISFSAAYIFVKQPVKTTIITHKKDSISIQNDFFSLDEAPSTSLRGSLSKVAGEVNLQTRLATEPAALSSAKRIQQGEALVTGEDGSLVVTFSDKVAMNISAGSNVDFVQTLPEHIVVIQREGSVEYKTEPEALVSVRSMHLVADIASGSDITLEKDAELLTFTVEKGSVIVAYNNLDNVTTKEMIAEGETYVFNDDTREGEVAH